MVAGADERTPLFQNSNHENNQAPEEIDLDKEDSSDPRHWTRRNKLTNVLIIALMAMLSPLASSMFTPAIGKIADCLETSEGSVIGATTGFVITLGLGPLVLAPMSETFGRRNLYLICFSMFTLLQIPTALSPNVETLITVRTISGFFGSVGIANGGGTISDMFHESERGSILGWYLLGPLLGPTLGPLFGGLIAGNLDWRWIFWITTIICGFNTTLGFIFLKESYRPKLLSDRCKQLSRERGGTYTYPGYNPSPMHQKLFSAVQRPIKLLATQPIVITMAAYQAVVFATMYTLYTNMQDIYRMPPYNFSITQVGCLFLFPGGGFLLAAWFLTPRADTIYNRMTENNNGKGKPEFRLPLAQLGGVLLPISMIWFAWTTEYRVHWLASISSTLVFGLGQVAIFSTVQNYYIDAFSKYAASAIAAGAVFRSLVGGVFPVFSPLLFGKLGYGWGWSLYALLCLVLAPAPTLFMIYGPWIRERFAIDL